MKHCKTMSEAISEASKKCYGWLVMGNGQYLGHEDALFLAQTTDKLDAEDDAQSDTYYLCSDEGAVGVTSKYEYLAEWLLMPLFRPLSEFEDLVEQSRAAEAPQPAQQQVAPQPTVPQPAVNTPQPMAPQSAANTPQSVVPQPSTNTPQSVAPQRVVNTPQPMAPQPVVNTPQPAPQQAVQQPTAPQKIPMFCMNCGKKLQPNARFCTECGAKVGPV